MGPAGGEVAGGQGEEVDEDLGRMGDGRLGQGGIPLKVKNTFIDVEDNGAQDEFEDGEQDGWKKRQVSEPPPSLASFHDVGGGMHGRALRNKYVPEFWPMEAAGDAGGMRQPGGVMNGEEDADDDYQDDMGPMHVQSSSAPNLAAAMANLARNMQGGGGMGGGSGGLVGPEGMTNPLSGTAIPPPEWANTTTVMMRNLPNKYTQRMLLTEINHTGFLGTFDFLYLPIDPETNANRGYSFLNFIDPGFSWMFKMSYEGRKMNRFNSNKVVSVVPATLQGFEANYAHYAAARVNRGDPAARPLFLREPKQPLPCATMPRGAGGQASVSQGGQGAKQRGGRRRGNGQSNPLGQMAMGLQSQPGMGAGMGMVPQGLWGMDGIGGMGSYLALDGMDFGNQMPYSMQNSAAAEAAEAAAAAEVARQRIPAAPAASAAASSAMAGMVPKFCPNCGSGIQAMFQFCPQCGGSLDFSALAMKASD